MELTFSEIVEMQRKLQAQNAYHWDPMCPEQGHKQLLWSICEMGEVIDIIKKRGDDAIMNDPEVRRHFIEEYSDVIMYLGDMMLCYNISVEELASIYKAKYEYNMTRWQGDRTGEAKNEQ